MDLPVPQTAFLQFGTVPGIDPPPFPGPGPEPDPDPDPAPDPDPEPIFPGAPGPVPAVI